ncbi:MAG: WGR domain-containing protein [Methylococcales bacterium]|nr:WGR domain-containing protein [Methylococcales bacterium]
MGHVLSLFSRWPRRNTRGGRLNRAYLVKVDLSRNQSRFYSIHVTKTIFENWAIVKEWGRIGSPGTVREGQSSNLQNRLCVCIVLHWVVLT